MKLFALAPSNPLLTMPSTGYPSLICPKDPSPLLLSPIDVLLCLLKSLPLVFLAKRWLSARDISFEASALKCSLDSVYTNLIVCKRTGGELEEGHTTILAGCTNKRNEVVDLFFGEERTATFSLRWRRVISRTRCLNLALGDFKMAGDRFVSPPDRAKGKALYSLIACKIRVLRIRWRTRWTRRCCCHLSCVFSDSNLGATARLKNLMFG